MNKKFIVLALAALPVAAFANVTIYGQLGAGFENNHTYSSTFDQHSQKSDNLNGGNQINDWSSRVGIRGTEGLGNGLKAIWQVESGLSLSGDNKAGSNQSGELASRESFVGLQGDAWGKVRIGKLQNYSYSNMQDMDPGNYSSQSVGGLGYYTRLSSSGVNNSVRYDSPDWDGFSFALLYGTDQTRNVYQDSNNDARVNYNTANIGFSYQKDGFFGKYSYQRWNDADKALKADQAAVANKDWHVVELGYNANNIYAVLSYQQIRGYGIGSYYNPDVTKKLEPIVDPKNTLPANGLMKTREAAMTLGYTFMGNLTPYASFVKGWDVKYADQTLSNTGYKQYMLGLNYGLSKQTNLYGSVGQVKWDNSALDKEKSIGVGMVHKF